MKVTIKIVLTLNLILTLSCSTLVTKYYSKEKLTIKGFEEKDSKLPLSNFFIKKDAKGKIFGEFISEYTLPVVFLGEISSDVSGDVIFYIYKIKYTTSWPNGFTEGENDASGAIKFHKEGNVYKAAVVENVEFWDLKKGIVRFFDDYYINEEGLEKVKNRMERLKSIVKYLISVKNEGLPEYFENAYFDTINVKSFWSAVKPKLFDKKRELPKELEELRKTETLLRDWEESYELMFALYNFDYFFKNILPDLDFVEKQK